MENLGLYFNVFAVVLVGTVIGVILARAEKYTFCKKDYFRIGLVSTMSFILFCMALNQKMTLSTVYVLRILATSILSTSFIVDVNVKELPDRNTLACLVITALILFSFQYDGWYMTVFIAAIMTLIFGGISIWTGSLGMGDVKLLFPIVILVTHYGLIGYAYNTLIPAMAYACYVLIKSKIQKEQTKMFAFGPFMIIGLILTITIFQNGIIGGLI